MDLRYVANGLSLELAGEKCIGCGLCVEVCPHAVFSLVEGTAWIKERGRCMECGACAQNCPTSAIKVNIGVGCAAAIIGAMFHKGSPSCDCGGDTPCCG